jgi:hypothetical protein
MLADYYKRRGEPIQAAEAYRRAELVGHGAGLHIGRLRTARKARKALKALGELQQQS